VAFLNARGEREEREFRDLWATSVQHQLDHLEGRMFWDRLSPLRRRMLLAKAAKGAR
jgi:peptide deformylase